MFSVGSATTLCVVLTVAYHSTSVAAKHAPVCYGYLGCFSMSYPWHNVLRPVPAPQSPENVDAQFYLYTRSRPQGFTVTKLPSISLQGSDYDGRKPTFFIAHGYQGSGDDRWVSRMKEALLERVDSNVIVVSWRRGAVQLNYLQAVSNTRIVAAELARVLQALLASYNAATSRFHLIGHSLGAHIMSYTAKRVTNIRRLTALDPAQPAFEGYRPEVRVDKTDANFVQVIHTNARPFFPFLGVGFMAAVGHVDFYLNGGWDQPSCIIPPAPPNILSLYDLSNATFEAITYLASCAHSRAIDYFTASINNKGCMLWGKQVNPVLVAASIITGGNIAQYFKTNSCSKDSCTPLGIETINYPARGSFFVSTTGVEPYCIPDPKSDTNMRKYRSINDIQGM